MTKGPRDHLLVSDTEVLQARTIAGKYRLGRLLGEGGMGAVYEAEHTGLGQRVAVKLLSARDATDSRALARFHREARAAAAVRHPNVVWVTDNGIDETGAPFLVMELLEGESLSSLMTKEGALPLRLAAAIGTQILAGLAAAHDQGVVHRDLKPANVFIAREADGIQRVKILDFGVSKFAEASQAFQVTAEGALIGTPQYMAPEALRGQTDVDARADLYAVGVLLYRMLTGRLPFAAEARSDLKKEVLRGRPAAPRAFRPDIPVALEAVIQKAMSVDREDRYPDARAFRSALHEAVEDMPRDSSLPIDLASSTPSARPERSSEPTVKAVPKWIRAEARRADRLTRGSLVGLAAVAVLAAVGAVVWLSSGPRRVIERSSGKTGAEPATAVAEGGEPLRFGMWRYLPAEVLATDRAPFLRYLSEELNRPVELVVVEDYLDQAARLARGELDLAALSPYSYVRAARMTPRVRLLAMAVTRAGDSSYEGYVLARATSDVQHLEDLRGKVFCYVSPSSTSGYLYPRAIFRREGMDPDSAFRATRFAGDHLSSLRALHTGACDGAAVYQSILLDADEHGMAPESFRVLASTDRMPSDAYCVRHDMDEALAARIKRALLALEPGSERAVSLFGGGGDLAGFAEANDSDYDSVRSIERYVGDDVVKRRRKR